MRLSGPEMRSLRSGDEAEVVSLWQRCGLTNPSNDPFDDIRLKCARDPAGLLVVVDDGVIIGSVMVGYEGHRGWINYLAVDPDRRREGVGRRLMREAENLLRAFGCPKINLQIRSNNLGVLAFYESMGYVVDDVVSLGRRLERG